MGRETEKEDMSTKIYNAYRFAGNIEDAQEWLFTFRKLHAAYLVDKLKMFINPKAPFTVIANIIREISQKNLNNELNVQASVMVYVRKKQIYIQFFAVDREVLEMVVDTDPRFQDFHYQNQTDRPDKVSAREWNHRKKVWDALTDEHSTFKVAGFTFELTPANFEYEIARQCCKLPNPLWGEFDSVAKWKQDMAKKAQAAVAQVKEKIHGRKEQKKRARRLARTGASS